MPPLTDLEKQQHELLREIEWAGGDNTGYGDVCPCCGGGNPNNDRLGGDGHRQGCKLAACLIAAAAKQATPTAHDTPAARIARAFVQDITDLQPEPFPSTPLCPQCHSKATYQSAESYTDRSRVCSCENGHTWALDAQGAEI